MTRIAGLLARPHDPGATVLPWSVARSRTVRRSLLTRMLLLALVFVGPVAAAQDDSTLVVASNFVIQSLDPGRGFETTTNMINHSTYESLTTFAGADLKTPLPSLAASWTISDDGLRYTMQLQPDVTFASGNPMTSADVEWSLERVINLKANPSFLLDAVADIQAPDPATVVITLSEAFPAFLAILSSPALSILDSQLVTENGGSAGPDASEADTAEMFLNGRSAGSGPYMMTSYLPDQRVVLERNPNYWGEAPAIDHVVILNITEAASQKVQLENGDVHIATGLSQDQVPSLEGVEGVTIEFSPAATTFYLLMNNNPDVGGAFSNPLVQEAVRYALDYEGILALVGEGATRLAGVIPKNFAGALPADQAVQTDRDKAISLLAEANLGTVEGELSYASDSVIWGVQAAILAQKIQADLAAVGMQVALDGLPRATALQKYRDAQDQLGMWSWAADYPSALNFLVYLPGSVVGTRAGWPADASPAAQEIAALGAQAQSERDPARLTELLLELDGRLASEGPYAPMFQPAALYAFRSDLEGVTFNTVWGVTFATVKRVP